jgi:multicomponent Na+:H+ antiporter subunit F
VNLQEFVAYAVLPTISAALLLCVFRLIRGPTLADRVVALDLAAMAIIALIGAYAVATGARSYLDVAVVLALMAFVGTIGFAYYLQKEKR